MKQEPRHPIMYIIPVQMIKRFGIDFISFCEVFGNWLFDFCAWDGHRPYQIDTIYSYCICKLWGLVIFAFSPSCICTFPKLYVFQFVFVFKFFSPSCIYIPPPKLYYAFTNMPSKVKELGANTFLWSFAQSVALIAISGSSPITSAK